MDNSHHSSKIRRHSSKIRHRILAHTYCWDKHGTRKWLDLLVFGAYITSFLGRPWPRPAWPRYLAWPLPSSSQRFSINSVLALGSIANAEKGCCHYGIIANNWSIICSFLSYFMNKIENRLYIVQQAIIGQFWFMMVNWIGHCHMPGWRNWHPS